MEFLAEIGDLISAAWAAFLGIIDPFVSIEAFVPALAVLIVAAIVLNWTSNFFLDLVALLLIASSLFALLLSINDVPEAAALGAALIVLVAGLVMNRGDAGSRKTKALDWLLIVAFGLGVFYVISGFIPGITLGGELMAALERAGEFMGRASDAAERGAEELNS